jgi:hypothetical protein
MYIAYVYDIYIQSIALPIATKSLGRSGWIILCKRGAAHFVDIESV